MANMTVTFLEANGNSTRLEVEEGVSLMEAAVKNGIPGIPADCGGACSCATCHVYFSPEWFERLSPMAADEEAMMESVDDPHPTSRLSCQVRLVAALDGIEVRVPEDG